MNPLLSSSVLKHLHAFSLYLLYCTGLLYFSNPSLGKTTFKLFLITSVISILYHLPRIWRNPAVILFAASLIIQLASWLYSKHHHPQFAEAHADFKRLGSFFLFVPIVWTLNANRSQPWFLMFVFFIGLCLTPFTKGDGFMSFFEYRSDFGIRNAQHPALLFSISLLALILFAKRIFLLSKFSFKSTKLLYGLAVIFCIAVLVATDTRSIFLGLSLAALFLVLQRAKKSHLIFATPILVLVFVGGLMVLKSGQFSDRWTLETATIDNVLHGNLENISNRSSSGIRIHSWVEGMKWFLDSPVVGWGANGKKLVIQESDALPEDIRPSFGHLHNSFIEIFVNNGILGFLLIVLTYGWLWNSIQSRARTSDFKDVRLFMGSFAVLWLTANCFESFMFYSSGMMVFGIVVAAVLNLTRNPDLKETSEP